MEIPVMVFNAQSNMYCLVYGQMSHWGKIIIASNIINILLYFKYNISKLILIFFIKSWFINLNITNKKDVINFNKSLNNDFISIIYASLLSNSNAIRNNKGTKILFYQESSHNDYLLYFHSLIANLGYCNTNIPKIITKLNKKGNIKKVIIFETWTYNQLNIIYNKWYNNNIKIIPNNINEYLTPLTLAIWIMNNSYKYKSNIILLNSNNFTYNEIILLINILKSKYNLNCYIYKLNNNYNICIDKESKKDLRNIIKSYIISSMKYKIE